MKSMENLPNRYNEIYAVDLQKNKKVALFVNILAIIIAVLRFSGNGQELFFL